MPTATPSPCVHSRVSFVSTRTTRAGSFEMIWREIEIDARRAATVTARARRRANETREWRLTLISAAARTDEESAFDGGSALRLGARLCVIGEIRTRGDDGSIELLARVVRAMDGLNDGGRRTSRLARRRGEPTWRARARNRALTTEER